MLLQGGTHHKRNHEQMLYIPPELWKGMPQLHQRIREGRERGVEILDNTRITQLYQRRASNIPSPIKPK